MAEAVILLKDLFLEEEEPAVDVELDKGRMGAGSFSVIFCRLRNKHGSAGYIKKSWKMKKINKCNA